MSWDRRDHVALGLVAVSVIGLLAAEERHRLVVPILVTAAACGARVLGVRFGPSVWSLLSMGALAAFLVQALFTSTSGLFAAVNLLLYLVVNKVHNLEQTRDFDQLLTIGVLLMLGTGVLAVSVMVIPFVVAFHLCAVRLLELQAVARQRDGGAIVVGGGLLRPMTSVVGSVLAVWVGAAVVFSLFPRVGAGTLQSRLVQPQHVSGFSTEVELGDIGQIKENDAIVARVQTRSPRGQQLRLLRMVAFQNFDGSRWRRDLRERRQASVDDDDYYRLIRDPPEELEWFGITVEPLAETILPLPVTPTHFRAPPRRLLIDPSGSVIVPRWSRWSGRRLQFEAAAVLRDERLLGRADLLATDAEAFLELPALDRRTEELAARLIPPGTSGDDAVARVLDHLRTLRYTLDLESASDPIAHFLFDTRAGHCELFASSMAVLLRAGGISARVVNGFRMNEYNAIGGYFIVRQADAHAWVEVALPGREWTVFDPTPPDPERSRWPLGLRRMSQFADLLLFNWDRYVISLSGGDQRLALETIQELATTAFDRLYDDSRAATAVAILGWAAAMLLWRRRRRRRPPQEEIVAIYAELRRRLSDASHPMTTVGPATLRRTLAGRQDRASTCAQTIIDLYVRARFGGASLTPTEVAAARVALRACRTRGAFAAAPATGGIG